MKLHHGAESDLRTKRLDFGSEFVSRISGSLSRSRNFWIDFKES